MYIVIVRTVWRQNKDACKNVDLGLSFCNTIWILVLDSFLSFPNPRIYEPLNNYNFNEKARVRYLRDSSFIVKKLNMIFSGFRIVGIEGKAGLTLPKLGALSPGLIFEVLEPILLSLLYDFFLQLS